MFLDILIVGWGVIIGFKVLVSITNFYPFKLYFFKMLYRVLCCMIKGKLPQIQTYSNLFCFFQPPCALIYQKCHTHERY